LKKAFFTPKNGDVFLPIPQAYMGKDVKITFSISPVIAEQKTEVRLSDKFRGVFSKEDGESWHICNFRCRV
jgi:hypothetical protein